MIDTAPKIISLPEYETHTEPREAIPDKLGEILWQTYRNYVDIEGPSFKNGYQWELRNQGCVGYIPLSETLGLELTPKCELDNLFRMLEYAYSLNIKFFKDLMQSDSLHDFYERLAKVLALRVLDRGRKGFYRAYLPETERLPYVKGRMEVLQLAIRPWDVRPICHYEEHTSDLEENQILAWTLAHIIRSGNCSNDHALPTLRQAYRMIQSFATPLPYRACDCIDRHYNRLNQDYQPMHALCRFFLEHSGPSHKVGDRTMLPFLIDMAQLFEKFVAEWLKVHLPVEFELREQQSVDIDRTINLCFRPDLVIYDASGSPCFVLDTKYKASIYPSTDDIAQVIAYAQTINCQEAVLVYPVELKHSLNSFSGNIRIRSLSFLLAEDLDEAGRLFMNQLLYQ